MAPTHADAQLLMTYYQLWDTPVDAEAWTLLRRLRSEGALESLEKFDARVAPGSREFALFDRVLCAFEQAGVLMKHGLMNPDLYFEAWASPVTVWGSVEAVVRGMRARQGEDRLFANLEWLSARAENWHAPGHPTEEPAALAGSSGREGRS
jgi:hypothetical protein